MKKIIIGFLIVLFVSSIIQDLHAQDYKFSLKKKKTDWLFVSMAGTYFTLSVLDLHSTYRGLANGCKEINPIMAPIIDNKPLTIAVKMGTTILVTYLVHEFKKKHKLAAYITFGLVILIEGYIVYHNYKIGGPRN